MMNILKEELGRLNCFSNFNVVYKEDPTGEARGEG
jgi:hypothetical protein